MTQVGRIHQVSVSPGGVPKLPVARARVTREGLEGDAVRHPGIHGGSDRAVCIYALEHIEALQAEGHPAFPGSMGENVTLAGLDHANLAPGDRIALGSDVVLEVVSYTTPCKTIRDSFDGGAILRVSQTENPGWSRLYARVLQEGHIAPGDEARLVRTQARLDRP